MPKPNVYLFPQWEDNYGYLIKEPHASEGILVDPCDLEMCLKILELNDCSASHILFTHHHDDHVTFDGDRHGVSLRCMVGPDSSLLCKINCCSATG